MLSYLIRRLLIMIPTFLGISLVIWLVMTISPGEPDAAGAGAGLDQGPPEDLSSLEQGRGGRMFRERFGLNRPRFWNDWTGLTNDEVLVALGIVRDGVKEHGPEAVADADRELEDWGHFAIPRHIDILQQQSDDPTVQRLSLGYLRQAAYVQRSLYPPGYKPSADERQRDRDLNDNNRLIKSPPYTFAPGADAAERTAVVGRWQAWFDERKEQWDHGTWDKFKIGLTETQFGIYWGNLFQGDFGLSNRTYEPVGKMIMDRLKYSLSIAVPAFLMAWILAVFLGVFGAVNHGTWMDEGLSVGLFVLYSIPTFVMGTILQNAFAVNLGIFPTEGFESADASKMTTLEYVGDVIWHITLPLIVYTYGGLAYISRQARSGMLRVLKSDYVRTARAKGLKERVVIWKHAVRNGMMPIVTLLGTALPVLLAGSVIVEYIFNIDGFGNLMLTSILQKDYNVVMGIQLITAALTLIGLLLTDLIYASMDPRISFE